MTKEQKKVEKLLCDYSDDMQELGFCRKRLEEDSSVSVSGDSVAARSEGNYGEPVPNWFERKTDLEKRITGLEAKTRPITSLLEYLESPAGDAKLAADLKVCFFQGNSQKQIAGYFNKSLRSVYNMRESLITKVMKFLRLSSET